MTSSIQCSTPLCITANDQQFHSLIEKVEAIPTSYSAQNYLTLAIVIQQEVEPMISIRENLKMEGAPLPAHVTQSSGFDKILKESYSTLDQKLLSKFKSDTTPLKELVHLTRNEEVVSQLSKTLLLVGHTNKEQSTLESMCEGAILELNKMKESIKGSFNFIARILISDTPTHFSTLTGPSETSRLENSQTLNQDLERRVEQSVSTLKPRECIVQENHFDEGSRSGIDAQLSFVLVNGEIIADQKQTKKESTFTDLRYESEELFSL